MRSIESSAKTIEDAIRQGLEKLNVSFGDVSIDIIQEGTKGLFGFVGGKEAKVRLTVKESEQEDDILSALSCNMQESKPEESPKPVEKPKQKQFKKKVQKEKPETVEVTSAPSVKEQPKAKVSEPVKPYPVSDPDSAAGKAQYFLANVTKLMNLDVTVESASDEEGNIKVDIHGDTLGILIGRRGETLDALQYLTSLNVNHDQDNYTRVTLDTENYRAKREEALKRLANRMANRAVKTGRKVVMEPMNPYERRILHSALQQNTAVTTHSEGDEPNRHVVISLK